MQINKMWTTAEKTYYKEHEREHQGRGHQGRGHQERGHQERGCLNKKIHSYH
jgi:hypothetical protein